MTIEEIQELWEGDAKIDSIRLDDESLSIPRLHSKYFNVLNSEKRILIEAEAKMKVLKKNKIRYFSGKMSKQELDSLGWSPWGDKILKSEIQTYVETDVEVIELSRKIEIQRIKTEFLVSIITNINNRNFAIKNAIDYRRFVAGS